jgi:hypothetical protein
MFPNIVTAIVRLNGVYDILCGACLLKFIDIPVLNTLHADMFQPALIANDLASRLLGYWIISYGSIRLCHYKHSPLVSLSYFLEAICLFNEIKYHPDFNPHNRVWNRLFWGNIWGNNRSSRLFFTSILSACFGYMYAVIELKDSRLEDMFVFFDDE